MKKVTLFFAICFSAVLVCAGSQEVKAADKSNASVVATKLNVRMKPTIKSPKAGTLLKGERVQVTGREGAWVEIAAGQSIKVYVSEVFLINGKLTNATNLRAGRSANAPSFGVLPAGTVLKTVGSSDRYGWIQVVPPENIRVYAYSDYIACDKKAPEKVKDVPEQTVPATTDTAAEAEKAAKDAPAEKPAVEKNAAEKPAAEVTAAPAVPAAPVVAAEKEVKAEEKKAEETAKAAVKTEEKKIEETVKAGDDAAKKLETDLAAIGAADAKEKITVSGKLYRVPASTSPVSDYAVIKEGKNQGYVCGRDSKFFEENVGKELTVSGNVFRIKGWKSPIVVLD